MAHCPSPGVPVLDEIDCDDRHRRLASERPWVGEPRHDAQDDVRLVRGPESVCGDE